MVRLMEKETKMLQRPTPKLSEICLGLPKGTKFKINKQDNKRQQSKELANRLDNRIFHTRNSCF
ncbi:MAG: hypothetical protein HQK91_14150 [Nitrospirae bacterium]|nr:hypothetical protein [Nitrospirota bacterium]